jgi:hypothetical protein
VEKGNGAEQDETEDQGQPETAPTQERGKPAADATTARDPWAGVPELGETTLPDGTTLRRDGEGKFWRPGEHGEEFVWDPEQGRWMRPDVWKEAPGTDDWTDPTQQWDDAWGGSSPEGWQDVPRAGGTDIAEGTLQRDPDGNYTLSTPEGNLKWNEQTGKWYDSASGRQVDNALDPVEGWQRGAETDAWAREHPDQPHPHRSRAGSDRGSVRP